MRLLIRLILFLSPFRYRLLLSILVGFLTVAMNIGLMATSGYLIAKAALHPVTILLLWIPIVGVRFFGLMRPAFRYLDRYISHDITFRLLAEIRVWVFAGIERLGRSLVNRHSGDLLTAVMEDVDTLQNFYLRVITPPCVALLSLILVLIFFSFFGLSLAVVLACFLIAAGVLLPMVTHAIGKPIGQNLVKTRARAYTLFIETVVGMTELSIFAGAGKRLGKVSREHTGWDRMQIRMGLLRAFATSMAVLLVHGAVFTLLVMCIILVSEQKLTGVDLTVIVLTAVSSFEAVLPLSGAFQYLGQSMEAGRRLFSIVDEKPALRMPGEKQGAYLPCTSAGVPANVHVKISDLCFRYARDEPEILRNFHLDLPAGKHIALVGPSGCGKSTCLELLLRLQDYQYGTIEVGSIDLRLYDEQTIRQMFAVVSQNAYLFNATVRENLRIAKTDATDEEIRRAAKIAQIDDFIMGLPDGYNSFIGEAGARLSGGERQRLALARVVLRDSPIVLLDEPTTGLDAVTEHQFFSALWPHVKGRSMLLVTHRLTGLERMDEILVLSDGRIVEQGTHVELLRKDGRYRMMWDLQNQMLQEHGVRPR